MNVVSSSEEQNSYRIKWIDSKPKIAFHLVFFLVDLPATSITGVSASFGGDSFGNF